MPSGMETTVILKIKNTLLTSVVFGSLDFPVDTEIGLELDHDSYILFDKSSEENIATGSLRVSMRDDLYPGYFMKLDEEFFFLPLYVSKLF